LYLAPRVRKNRLNIDPDSLIPKLPSPKDLQPFPTQQSISYEGHTGRIRCFSIDPVGLYMVSGSDDNTVKLWEISTGRCLKTWKFDSVIHSVAWNPNRELCVFAVSIGHGNVILIAPPRIGSPEQITLTDQYFQQGYAAMSTSGDDKDDKNPIPWIKPSEEDQETLGYKVQLSHTQAVKQITWHRKGDYFSTVAPDAKNLAVLIHQITKYQSQAPFRKLKGLVQRVMFHPIKPLFFVAVSTCFLCSISVTYVPIIHTHAPLFFRHNYMFVSII
jgi:ribosome biogenesis protein ERB1